jgi:MFS family permease
MGMAEDLIDTRNTTDVIDIKRDRLVILASSLGTVFEWYDFFIYATVAPIIAKLYFPAGSEMASLLLALLTFGIGFGVRPFGAAVFGVLGDMLGRKFTFLITISLMGAATAALGLVPTFKSWGIAAPITLVVLRALQGLALGGEYGGAAIYVAEHAPRDKRGLYTSFIQASVVGGIVLSLAVVLSITSIIGKPAWAEWGWRLPFLFSLILLGISLWIRFMLKESPVFQAMKDAGETAKNPLRESFNTWPKFGRICAAMLGVAAGLTVVWYTAQLQTLYFLENALRVDDTSAQLIIMCAATLSLFWFVLFGWLSDKVGRKPPIMVGYVLTLFLMFPLFHMMADGANQPLAQAISKTPIVVTGSDCLYDPFAKVQPTVCGKLLDILSKRGLAYSTNVVAPGTEPSVVIGSMLVDAKSPTVLDAALKAQGYNLEKGPPRGSILKIMIAVVLVGMLSGLTYGSVAAYLVELFPARVRYTSMSIPYHIGAGYFGGFLPAISQYIVAKSGNPFAWLWYPIGVVFIALIVLTAFLPETAGKELD